MVHPRRFSVALIDLSLSDYQTISLSLCLSLSSLSLVRIFRLASIEDGEPRDRSIFFVKFDDERWGSRFS